MDKTCEDCANYKPKETRIMFWPEHSLEEPCDYIKTGDNIFAKVYAASEKVVGMLAEILTAYYAGKIITINRVISAPYSGMHYIDEKFFQRDADKETK